VDAPFLISLLCAARGGWKKLFWMIKKLKFGGPPSAKYHLRLIYIYIYITLAMRGF